MLGLKIANNLFARGVGMNISIVCDAADVAIVMSINSALDGTVVEIDITAICAIRTADDFWFHIGATNNGAIVYADFHYHCVAFAVDAVGATSDSTGKDLRWGVILCAEFYADAAATIGLGSNSTVIDSDVGWV